ncbi:class I SAM-dependent methyltransferase [Pelagibius marinus]|uniref:class I SAM-dependent methyltransferase n=1 Tax=Pelagibius marinus TaxID=2762760 RepID=UPI001872DBF7|nr:class I SAM-dependent methyltransferase [Pelagibius marinus]
MEILTEDAVSRFLVDDPIGALMDVCSEAGDEALVCQRWLRDSAPKRLIFERLYGDLLHGDEGRRVLDVGGGVTCLTRLLAARQRYELVDLMAHSDEPEVERARGQADRPYIHVVDWYEFTPKGTYDVVIANDLFPNVDQRLPMFLAKMLPIAREVRLSLTYYPQGRFYMTRRVDGDEVFCMLAWDGDMTARVLDRYADRIVEPDLGLLTSESRSVYPNGRQVCLAVLKGDQG